MLEIISLIAGIISIILGLVSIILSVYSISVSKKMNKDTEDLLKRIEKIALQNKKSIGFAEEIMENM